MTVEEIRQSLNLTQREFAERLGISRRSYTNKIQGVFNWTVPELLKVAEYGEITIPSGSGKLVVRLEKKPHNIQKR